MIRVRVHQNRALLGGIEGLYRRSRVRRAFSHPEDGAVQKGSSEPFDHQIETDPHLAD